MTTDPLRALVEKWRREAVELRRLASFSLTPNNINRLAERVDERADELSAALSLAGVVEPEVPLCDNPSGLWCKQCRGCRELGIGMTHCSDPINCGNMEPMAHHDDCPHTKGDTGVEEADRLINRLMSSDPNYQDCSDAAALIRQYAMLAAAPAAQCGRCGANTGEACDDRGCGYLNAGNGAPAAPAVVVDEAMKKRASTAYHAACNAGSTYCQNCGGTGRERDNYTECETCEGSRLVRVEGAPDAWEAALAAALGQEVVR